MNNIPTRFERRWSGDNREWLPSTKFDEELARFKNDLYENEITDDLFTRHCLYCCASTPMDRLVFDMEELRKVFAFAKAGDIVLAWLLSEEPKYYEFRCPDLDGLFPTKGAY